MTSNNNDSLNLSFELDDALNIAIPNNYPQGKKPSLIEFFKNNQSGLDISVWEFSFSI